MLYLSNLAVFENNLFLQYRIFYCLDAISVYGTLLYQLSLLGLSQI